MRRDYYAVLGVASTAGLREVRQAYRRLARQYSPDVNFWDTQARDLFGEIEEAYRVLSDPAARAMYDRFGHALRDGEALAAGRHGEDVHVTVQLAFADVVRGTNLRLEGARIRVPTPSGEAVLVIPPGTTGGQVFRLRGQGLPRLSGEAIGDLFVAVRIEIPIGLDARTHELVRELQRLMPLAPRTALERY